MNKLPAVRWQATKMVVMTTMAAMAMAVGASAQKAATTAYVNSAAVKAAALHAATTITGVGQGFVPYVSDGSGTLSPSSIFQLSGNIGVNNTAPAVPLHAGSAAASGTQIEAEGANGSFAVVNHGNAPNSANFTFVTASNGTLAGDELGQLGGIGSLPGGALGGSTSVKEVFAAAATFAPGSTPGEILWYTTPIGSTSHQLRMTLDQNGRLGIGTAAPGAPLEVNGAIQIDNANLVLNGSSGIQFPTGTQSAPGVVSVTQGNSSITVGGTALAPTVAVNTGVIQPLLNGTTSCPSGQAVASINPSTGAVTCGSVGPGGTLANVPMVVFNNASTPFTDSYPFSKFLTVPLTAAGFYSVSIYMNTPLAAQGSCTSVPCQNYQLDLSWNDGASSATLIGPHCDTTAPCASAAVLPIYVASGNILVEANGYGSGSAPTSGQYTAYVVVEQL